MDDELEFEKYVMAEAQKELEKVSKDIEATLKSKVQKNVYNKYKPLTYNRKFQLRDKIKISKGVNEAIISWQGQEYINNNEDDVSDKVVDWIDKGFRHKNWTGKEDKYHMRNPSNFISETILEINKRYGEVCQEIRW